MKLFVVFGFVFSALLVHNIHCLSFGIKDVGKSVVNTGVGVLSKVPDAIPTPEALFQSGKNIIAGYPFDVAFKLINTFCKWHFSSSRSHSTVYYDWYFIWIETGSASLSSNQVKPRFTPNISSMNFVLKFDHEDYLIPLTSPDLLWKHEKFNPSWPLVLLATGWTTNYNNSAVDNGALDHVYEAYHCRGNINFVVSVVFINLSLCELSQNIYIFFLFCVIVADRWQRSIRWYIVHMVCIQHRCNRWENRRRTRNTHSNVSNREYSFDWAQLGCAHRRFSW